MKKISEIKRDLYDYVSEYEQKRQQYEILEGDNALYKEILDDILSQDISGICANCTRLGLDLSFLFGEEYDYLIDRIHYVNMLKNNGNLTDEEVNKLRNNILICKSRIWGLYLDNRAMQEEIKKELLSRKEKKTTCLRVLNSLKENEIIQEHNIYDLRDLLIELGYTDTEVSYTIEKLYIRNNNINVNNNAMIGENKITKFITMGYEKIEYPKVDEEKRLISFADVIINFLNNNMLEEVDLDVLLSDFVKKEDRQYILSKVLEKIQDDIYKQSQLIRDTDFMMSVSIKKDIVMDAKKMIDKYNYVRDYLINNVSLEEDTEEIEEEAEEKIEVDNVNLLYLIKQSGKSYVLDDLKDMPKEYITKAYELIEEFKTGIGVKKVKKLSHRDSFCELKDDQIRIILKRLQENNFVVYGAFIKKENRSHNNNEFLSIISRSGEISREDSELREYVEENGRKWTR